MKNEKIFLLTNELIKNIKSHEGSEEYNQCKIYINTWVFICSLELLKKKAQGEDIRNYDGKKYTYKELFSDFIHYYSCESINPKMKNYALLCLFNIKNRDIIIKLFESIFNKEEQDQKAIKLNYVPYSQLTDKATKYYIIERSFLKNK